MHQVLCALAENRSQSMYYVWKSIFFYSTKEKKHYRKAVVVYRSVLNKFLRIYCLCIHRWACCRRTIPFSVTHSLALSSFPLFFPPSFSKTDLIVTRISNKLVTRNVTPHHMQAFKLIVAKKEKKKKSKNVAMGCDAMLRWMQFRWNRRELVWLLIGLNGTSNDTFDMCVHWYA